MRLLDNRFRRKPPKQFGWRVVKRSGDWTPKCVQSVSVSLRSSGLSRRKVEYLKGVADLGTVAPCEFESLTDDELRTTLPCARHWSMVANMLLIFSYSRTYFHQRHRRTERSRRFMASIERMSMTLSAQLSFGDIGPSLRGICGGTLIVNRSCTGNSSARGEVSHRLSCDF